MAAAVTIPTRPNVPRIIRSSATPFKDGLTLVWYKKGKQDVTNPRWKWWDGVFTSIADLEAWHEKVHARALVVTEPSDVDALPVYATKGAIGSLFVPQSVLDTRVVSFWERLGVPIFNLTNLHANYPYLSYAWDGTLEDAIGMVAIFYRYRRLVMGGSELGKRREVLESLGVKVGDAEPPQIWLLTQYFVHKVAKRAKEFRQCLKNNLLNPLVDKIVYLNETDLTSEWSGFRGKEKVIQEIIGERLTYKHMLHYTFTHVPDNVIVVYANADIYLNDTLRELFNVDMKDKLFALLRYDETDDGGLKLFGPRADSQDTWMLLSDSVKSRTWDWESFNYRLGTAGCDNRFTADMFAMRFVASNPCNSLQTVHIHKTEIRDYNPRDMLSARFYLHLTPCPLLNMDQTKFPPAKTGVFPSRTATVRIQSPNPKQAQTFTVMLGRFKRFVWAHDAATPYTSVPRTIHKWSNANVISSGLVFDYGKTYIDTEVGGPYFQDATLPTHIDYNVNPTFVGRMLAIPAKRAETLSNPDLYLLQYFTYAAQLSEQLRAQDIEPCSFFVPEPFMSITNFFRIGDIDEISAVKWTPTSVVHGKEVYGLLPEGTEWGTEDIRTLRKCCRIPHAPKTKKRCILLTDAVFTESAAKEQIGGVLGDAWEVVCVDRLQTGPAIYSLLQGADLCLLYNLPDRPVGEWAKLWATPAGCKVVEFQNELKATGDFQHFAAACEFDTHLIPLHKASAEDVMKQAMKAFREVAATF